MPAKLKENLLETFVQTIKINEVFGQENEIICFVKDYLHELGLNCVQDFFGNVFCKIPGQGQPLMINTHLDIPEPAPEVEYVIEGDILRSTGKSILGADPKSGLAVLLELANYLVRNKITTRPLELVFTLGEEAGLQGSKNLDYSLLEAKQGIVLDEDGRLTNVVIQAPGKCELNLHLRGKTAHARDWRDGVNAGEHLAKIMSSLQQGEISEGVTFNIGKIYGGLAINSVPGEAGFQSELRSFDMPKLRQAVEMVTEQIYNHCQKVEGLSIKIDKDYQFTSYRLDTESSLIRQLKDTYRRLGLSPNLYATFGASDANVFNSNGVETVAIGSEYYLAHQYDEYINLQGMTDLVLLLVELVQVGKS